MKIALLGDIHGNDLALQVVLTAALASGVDQLLVTGDLVGYYFSPLKVLELLHPWKKHVVRGNHEEMLAAARSNEVFLKQVDNRYGTGLRVAIEQLNLQQLDELCTLPHPLALDIDGCKTLLCHGSPWSIEQYIYPDASSGLFEGFASEGLDLVVLGHTHYPMSHQVGKTLVVNPGSVGQPRNYKPGASWAIFDTKTQSLQFKHEIYDSSSLALNCQLRHPELPFLSEVLTRSN